MGGTLLIDNHDSFTYNLYALIAQATGTPPRVVLNDEVTWDEVKTRDFDRIVISPGPGRPQRPSDVGLSAEAVRQHQLPVLGICLGHQLIAYSCGARVDLASQPVHGGLCRVSHLATDLFLDLPSPFTAVRYHSLAVTDLPPDLEATAWAEDGTIMAIRHRHRSLWGLQFHPESICTEHGLALLQRFHELTPSRSGTSELTRPRLGIQPPRRLSASRSPTRIYSQRVRADAPASAIFAKLYRGSRHAFWLDSPEYFTGGGRYSYMGDSSGPRSEIVSGGRASNHVQIKRHEVSEERSQDIFSYLQSQEEHRYTPPAELPFDFQGGYVGYFGYELAATTLGPSLAGHRIAPGVEEAPQLPLSSWVFADRVVAFDHARSEIWLLCVDDCQGLSETNSQWMQNVTERIQHLPSVISAPRPAALAGSCELRWRHQPAEYLSMIERAQALIRLGESYEVCLTTQLYGACSLDPLDLYLQLRHVNPAPYCAYFTFGPNAVLCSSPELFLQIEHDRTVTTKPIKGTVSRGSDPDLDRWRAQALRSSAKMRAENLMIVDLLRHDLNRVCRPGSVEVPTLFGVESYATVHQLVSTVRGHLAPDNSVIDCIRAAFPGGSMTGAPKERTTRILRELEGAPRGVYSGSLGYLSVTGSAKLNIVIRTIVSDRRRISMGTGGAILAVSNPEEELWETRLKVAPLLRALEQAGAAPTQTLIEPLSA
jgi:para-aminobenzoate synthetase